MTKYVVFENEGEIDARLIKTFGANVKENSNAIGFFGTGLKYAIAILTRENCRLEINSGTHTHTFGTECATIRGADFEFVTMDGEPMGFTTEVGKNWEMWMAYRELFCNCQDEGGRIYDVDTEEGDLLPVPQEGKTIVVVDGREFIHVRSEHDKHFLSVKGNPVSSRNVDIYPGEDSHTLFYQGVAVGNLPRDVLGVNTYNFTRNLSLTEDRTYSHEGSVCRDVSCAVLGLTDRGLIRSILTAPEATFERSLDFNLIGAIATEQFLDVTKEQMEINICGVNHSAVKLYERIKQERAKPAVFEPDEIETKILGRAMSFCESLGYEITHSVVLADNLGKGVLGLAKMDTNEIYIARKTLERGIKQVVITLIEEQIHLEYGHADCTREMQEHLLHKMVSLGERAIGEPIG